MGSRVVCIREKIRSPIVEGLFYPGEKVEAEKQLRMWGLDAGNGRGAAAIFAPHGAWDICGDIAGEAFSAARGRREIVRTVMLGTIHDSSGEGVFFSDSHHFDTPLGKLPVDMELGEELASCSTHFEINDIPHLKEHSLEVLLPLVKYCFPHTAIIPILMGGRRSSLIAALARALRIVFESLMAGTLLVVSTDLATAEDEGTARKQAEEFLGLIREKDAAALEAAIAGGRISACGGAITAAVLQSGLAETAGFRVVSDPPIRARQSEGSFTCYGAAAFEQEEGRTDGRG
jgi:AmmeMemoRadiSam system protein B